MKISKTQLKKLIIEALNEEASPAEEEMLQTFLQANPNFADENLVRSIIGSINKIKENLAVSNGDTPEFQAALTTLITNIITPPAPEVPVGEPGTQVPVDNSIPTTPQADIPPPTVAEMKSVISKYKKLMHG